MVREDLSSDAAEWLRSVARQEKHVTHRPWKMPRGPRPNWEPRTGKYRSKNFMGQPNSDTTHCQSLAEGKTAQEYPQNRMID